MGTVIVTLEISSPVGKKRAGENLDAFVDTGATLSIIPERVLRRVGIKPIEQVHTRLADDRVVTREVGEARLRLDGHSVTSRVIFGKAHDATVVGLVVLESLGLTVDPIARRLIPTEFLML